MKTLVFSDTHLSEKFENAKYQYLTHIIKEAKEVVINGDFWDAYDTTFDKFINSEWKRLFSLLKSRNTTYVYGNHDKSIFSDKRVQLFSNSQTIRFEIKTKNKNLIIEHGNRLLPLLDEVLKLRRQSTVANIIQRIADPIHLQLLRRFDRKLFKLISKNLNNKIKKEVKKELRMNEIFVCGHTHWAEMDLENNYVNVGVNHYGLGQYLWITDNNITQKEVLYDKK